MRKATDIECGADAPMRHEADSRGLIYFFGRQMRFSGSVQAARKAVAERRLAKFILPRRCGFVPEGLPVESMAGLPTVLGPGAE